MYTIGLMSGTSMDAIDAALVELTQVASEVLQLRLVGFTMHPLDAVLRAQVQTLLPPHSGSTAAVCALDVVLAEAFAAAALEVARTAGVAMEHIDLIASHGQTVYHEVAADEVRSTLQLGSPAVIAERTGCTTIAGFRSRDIAAGGQGAPLVPYLDVLLFGDPQRYRAVHNIGGMANVTYLPPGGPVLAFDTGPGNVLIDEAVRLLSDGALLFDQDGSMATAGTVHPALLTGWLAHPYFEQPPPKSTGREAWGTREAAHYVAEASGHGLAPADIIATLTALTAHSIARAYTRHLGRVNEMVVSGGGARNPVLLQMLHAALPTLSITTADAWGLDADAKEAVAFAVLGYTTLHSWSNNVPSATGANQAVVLGSITPGRGYRQLLAQVLATPDQPPRRIQLVAASSILP